MSALHTEHPLALRILLDEELYQVRETAASPSPAAPLAAAAAAAEPVAGTDFEYLGHNRRFILLLVHEPGEPAVSPATLESLNRILGGLNLTLEDVALLNLARYPDATFNTLKGFFACSKAVLFGIDPARLGLPALPSNEISALDRVKLLATFSFQEMNAQKQKKRIFWDEMKKL